MLASIERCVRRRSTWTGSTHSGSMTKNKPKFQEAVVKIINDPKTKPQDLLALASVVERHGHARTAAALRSRADVLRRTGTSEAPAIGIGQENVPATASAPAPDSTSQPVVGIPSPWKDVPSAAWTKFVKAMGDRKTKDVDPRYRLGIFGIGARRLVDLGIMKNPKKTTWKDQKGVWLAEWLPPHSEEKFLSSPEAQYRSFMASMIDYRRSINQQFADKPAPKPVSGKRVSLSGLLAVAHHAGMGGLGKWLSGERRVPATTKAFESAAEIF